MLVNNIFWPCCNSFSVVAFEILWGENKQVRLISVLWENKLPLEKKKCKFFQVEKNLFLSCQLFV